ncbi:hypothetical protein GCM10027040_02120 [Halomonas shantousis]
MKTKILLAMVLASSLLAGCQGLNPQPEEPVDTVPSSCLGDIPTLADNICLVDAWVGFGLQAQRGDDEWRERMLSRLDGAYPGQRLARAVVLSWGNTAERRDRASELFKADISAAPSRLQPLLQQWLNGLEARRQLNEKLAQSQAQYHALQRENAELAQKIDALTAIEQSINSRQSP